MVRKEMSFLCLRAMEVPFSAIPGIPGLAYIYILLGGKQMKKLISLLLVLAMALTLVACGAKEEAPAATEAPAAEAAPEKQLLQKARQTW